MTTIATTSRVLLVISAVFYATFLPEIGLGFPLDPVHAYLSEYAAADSPHRPIFVVCDSVASVTLMVAMVLLWREANRGRSSNGSGWEWKQWVIAASLFMAGVFTIVDVIFPMPCAESLPGCADAGLDMHLIASSIVVTFHVIAAVGILWILALQLLEGHEGTFFRLLGRWRYRRPAFVDSAHPQHPESGDSHPLSARQRFTIWLEIFMILGFLFCCLDIVLISMWHWPVGLVQRFQVFFISGFIVGSPLALARCAFRTPARAHRSRRLGHS